MRLLFFRKRKRSRKKRRLLFPLILVTVIAVFSGFSWHSWKQDWESTRKFVPVTVERVTSGSTFSVYVPEYRVIRDVKMIGVTIADENRPFTAEEMMRKLLEGNEIWLETDTQLTAYTGELLAYVWLEKPEKITEEAVMQWNCNCMLLEEGYAVPDESNEYNKKYSGIFAAAAAGFRPPSST